MGEVERGLRRTCIASVLACGCAAEPPTLPANETDGSTGAATTARATGDDTTSGAAETSTAGASSGDTTTGGTDESTGAPIPVNLTLDIAIVVDNTLGNGPAQAKLAAAMDGLVTGLRAATATLDVHVVVTTTDFSNPLCTAFQPDDYEPALGNPQSRSCRDHLADFASLNGMTQTPEVCEQVCPEGTVLPGSVIAFTTDDSNVEGATVQDALRCLVPQGINGCGFEATLQAAVTLVDATQCWNAEGGCARDEPPFLRPDADLAVIVLTNELDCSVTDPDITQDDTYWSTNPETGQPMQSSAICFNAGASCDGPDPQGNFSNCVATADGNMFAVAEVVQRLVGANPGKHVTFVPMAGYAPAGPAATEYRTWRDGKWPAGDLTPEQVAMGVTAERQDFAYGLGPGCVEMAPVGGWTQAIAPVRTHEVCEAIDGAPNGDCCPSSLCGDYDAAMQCLIDRATSGG